MIVKFISSIRVAVILVIILIVLTLLATFIPQGEKAEYYLVNYPEWLARLILFTHYYNFYRSAVFMVPAGLLFINLLVCTLRRLKRQIYAKKKRFGPDIIHVGMIILMIGGMITLLYRKEASVSLQKGGDIELDNGYKLVLDSFEFQKYKDGRPKAWISHVNIFKNNKPIGKKQIQVNDPLNLGTYKVYQESYQQVMLVLLEGKDGEKYHLTPNQSFKEENSLFYFAGVLKNHDNQNVAIIKQVRDKKVIKTYSVTQDEDVAGNRVIDVLNYYRTGLMIVQDPGFYPVLISLIVITMGLLITYVQKLREKSI
ncbi:MAG: cytochrome c biogenesis protein ResB [bacterium]|nr:cytochrome c biogenesis protein ResB [bacterium]